MFRLLNHNEADLVLTLDSRIYDAEYVIIHEKQVETYFVAAPNSPLAGRERVGPEELPAQPFLLTEKNMSYRRLLDQQLAARSLELRPVLETGNVELIRALARQGAGCAFLPEYAVAEDLAAGRLVQLAVEGLEIEIWQQLLCHRDKWISPRCGRPWSTCRSCDLGLSDGTGHSTPHLCRPAGGRAASARDTRFCRQNAPPIFFSILPKRKRAVHGPNEKNASR